MWEIPGFVRQKCSMFKSIFALSSFHDVTDISSREIRIKLFVQQLSNNFLIMIDGVLKFTEIHLAKEFLEFVFKNVFFSCFLNF